MSFSKISLNNLFPENVDCYLLIISDFTTVRLNECMKYAESINPSYTKLLDS